MKKLRRSLYARYRFSAEVISLAVWPSFRFPLSCRMVEEMLAPRGIEIGHKTVRRWAEKFRQAFVNCIRRRTPRPGDRWHLDEVVITIAGKRHWLWRAVDQDGFALDGSLRATFARWYPGMMNDNVRCDSRAAA